jgi:hypothetical protein
VINRGNLQHDVFATAGTKHTFLVTLGEAAVQFGWRASAFVVICNHYHLALETPEPNLVAGMHWLRSIFAIRQTPKMSAPEIAELKSARWQQALEAALHETGKCLRDAENSAKGAEGKIAIAGKLRQSVAAPYHWIAETLKMGHPGSVCGHVSHQNQRSTD